MNDKPSSLEVMANEMKQLYSGCNNYLHQSLNTPPATIKTDSKYKTNGNIEC